MVVPVAVIDDHRQDSLEHALDLAVFVHPFIGRKGLFRWRGTMFHFSGLAHSAVSMEGIHIISGAGQSDSVLFIFALLSNRHGDDCLGLLLVNRDKFCIKIPGFNQKVLKFLLDTLAFRMVEVDVGPFFLITSQIFTVLL